MRIPSAININTLRAYEIYPGIISRHNQTLESFNLEKWDEQIPTPLRQLCVETIAKNWKENPILNEIVLEIDRYFLLDILDTDLPLKLTIPKIPDDIYWKKCYLEKWPKQLPSKVKSIHIKEIFRDTDIRKLSSVYSGSGSGSSGSSESKDNLSRQSSQASEKSVESAEFIDPEKRTWKEYYIEMHLKEYLENLKPENYDYEKIKELSELCSSYVRFLRIDQMQCSESSPNRIPLNLVLNGFQQLKELSLCFKQRYVGEQFSWNVLNTVLQDIKLLAKGLEKLRLQTLRIRNSDINCEKLIIILKALLKHELKVIDFCHCKIADRGTLAISKFVLEVPVKEVNLANNRIGPKGVEYLSYALLQPTCTILTLDLQLNELSDTSGNLLLTSLNRNIVKSIFLNGCGFSRSLSVGQLLQTNSSLEFLDISNNNLGENVGQDILQGLKYNSTIKKLDLRMCRILSETEFRIQELVNAKRKGTSGSTSEHIIHDEITFELFNEEFILEFEKILQ